MLRGCSWHQNSLMKSPKISEWSSAQCIFRLTRATFTATSWPLFLILVPCWRLRICNINAATARLHSNWAHAEKQLSPSVRSSEMSVTMACGPRMLAICCCFFQDAWHRPSSFLAFGVGGSDSLTDSSLWACSEPYGERLCTCITEECCGIILQKPCHCDKFKLTDRVVVDRVAVAVFLSMTQ